MDNTLLNEFEEYLRNMENLDIDNIIEFNFNKETSIRYLNINSDNSVEMTNDILNELKIDKKNINPLKFIFHELIGNIYDHAHSKNALILGRKFEETYEFIFMDDGISIPNSLKNNNFQFENDCEGIIQAINGLSTKNELGYIERGTGLNNTINIVSSGGNGETLIASGEGLICITKDNTPFKKKISKNMNGTIIILRINLSKKIDIYKYLNQVKY